MPTRLPIVLQGIDFLAPIFSALPGLTFPASRRLSIPVSPPASGFSLSAFGRDSALEFARMCPIRGSWDSFSRNFEGFGGPWQCPRGSFCCSSGSQMQKGPAVSSLRSSPGISHQFRQPLEFQDFRACGFSVYRSLEGYPSQFFNK